MRKSSPHIDLLKAPHNFSKQRPGADVFLNAVGLQVSQKNQGILAVDRNS
jgi:hypothetical protein